MYTKYAYLLKKIFFSSSSSVSYIGQHHFRNSFILRGQQATIPIALFWKLATITFLLLETQDTWTWVCDSVLLDHAFSNSLYLKLREPWHYFEF